jgi:hypothetical protein
MLLCCVTTVDPFLKLTLQSKRSKVEEYVSPAALQFYIATCNKDSARDAVDFVAKESRIGDAHR